MSVNQSSEFFPKPEDVRSREFNQLYSSLTDLSRDQQVDFVLHDSNSLFCSLGAASLLATGEFSDDNLVDYIEMTSMEMTNATEEIQTKTGAQSEVIDCMNIDVKPAFDAYGRIEQKTKEVRSELSSRLIEKYGDDIPQKIRLQLQKIEALDQFLPIMRASAMFLQLPTEQNFKALDQMTIDLSRLYLLTTRIGPTTEKILANISDKPLSGTQATIFINLLSNAHKYSDFKTPVEVVKNKDGSYTVSNDSSGPLPQKFGLGMKGENGLHGYGLYIAKLMACKKGLQIDYEEQPTDNSKYKISFTVRKKQPTPDDGLTL